MRDSAGSLGRIHIANSDADGHAYSKYAIRPPLPGAVREIAGSQKQETRASVYACLRATQTPQVGITRCALTPGANSKLYLPLRT